MASQGPNSAGSGSNDNSRGATAWANPTRIVASDDSRAQASSIPSGSQSQILKSSSHGHSISGSDTIVGIQVEIERSAGAASRLKDYSVKLLKAGSEVGSNLADTSTFWPAAASEAYATYGGATELWGTTWTPSDVNDSGFGVALQVDNVSAFSTSSLCDHIRTTIYYTSGSGAVLRQLMMTGVGK